MRLRDLIQESINVKNLVFPTYIKVYYKIVIQPQWRSHKNYKINLTGEKKNEAKKESMMAGEASRKNF